MPAKNNSGSWSPLAIMQPQFDARAKQGMPAANKGHFFLLWRGVLAADHSAVLQACCYKTHVFVFGVPSGLSTAWVRCVQSGRVSPRSLLAAFRLRIAPPRHTNPA